MGLEITKGAKEKAMAEANSSDDIKAATGNEDGRAAESKKKSRISVALRKPLKSIRGIRHGSGIKAKSAATMVDSGETGVQVTICNKSRVTWKKVAINKQCDSCKLTEPKADEIAAKKEA